MNSRKKCLIWPVILFYPLLYSCLCVGLISATRSPVILEARVIRVYDGDSMRVQISSSIPSIEPEEDLRLIGINAYEMTDSDETKKVWANIQRDYVYSKLGNQNIKIELEVQTNGMIHRDPYHRLLGYIIQKDGTLLQLDVLGNGVIQGYYKFPFDSGYKIKFKEAENQAKKKKKGLYQWPPELIPVTDSYPFIGSIKRVKMRIWEVNLKRHVILTTENPDAFQLFIPDDYICNFQLSDENSYFLQLKNKIVYATGFIGSYRGKPQIRIYSPLQIEVQN